jgi:hypothetical protein
MDLTQKEFVENNGKSVIWSTQIRETVPPYASYEISLSCAYLCAQRASQEGFDVSVVCSSKRMAYKYMTRIKEHLQLYFGVTEEHYLINNEDCILLKKGDVTGAVTMLYREKMPPQGVFKWEGRCMPKKLLLVDFRTVEMPLCDTNYEIMGTVYDILSKSLLTDVFGQDPQNIKTLLICHSLTGSTTFDFYLRVVGYNLPQKWKHNCNLMINTP